MEGELAKFETLKNECLRDCRLYEDPDFSPGQESLGTEDGTVAWMRPKDIAADATFRIQGQTRFDFDHGSSDNRSFVRAVATVAAFNDSLLERVCPGPPQCRLKFDPQEYAGIFRFTLWSAGRWHHVIIDDRLPVDSSGDLLYASNCEQANEFWVPLLQKAYAKLRSSYQAANEDDFCDVMEALTGGVCQTVQVREWPRGTEELFDTIDGAQCMLSLVTACVGTTKESCGDCRLENGIFKSQAYSITGTIRDIKNHPGFLVRLRLPSGEDDWCGAWCRKSPEWKSVNKKDKKNLGLVVKEEGEFWMSCDDFRNIFDTITMCHLSADKTTSQVARETGRQAWVDTTFEGGWCNNETSGGSTEESPSGTILQSPQFHINFTRAENDDSCTVLLRLTIVNMKGQDTDRDVCLTISKCEPGVERINQEVCATSGMVKTKRHLRMHVRLPSGQYGLVASTKSQEKCRFVLQLLTQSMPGTVRLMSFV